MRDNERHRRKTKKGAGAMRWWKEGISRYQAEGVMIEGKTKTMRQDRNRAHQVKYILEEAPKRSRSWKIYAVVVLVALLTTMVLVLLHRVIAPMRRSDCGGVDVLQSNSHDVVSRSDRRSCRN